MTISPAQILRCFRLPFSPGGRNFLFWQLVDRGQRFCHAAARWYRATLARRKRVVMVVGSYGKTTTTRAVAVVLDLPVDRWLELNANCLGLVAWSLLRQPPWRRHAAIEAGIGEPVTMSVHAATLRPQIVVVTCIGSEHLQSFRDVAHLRSEKATAVRALPADGTAVLNADDPNVAWMATQTNARVLRYGFQPECDVRATAWTPDWPHGLTATIDVRGETFLLRSRFMGRNSVYALLAAVAVGVAEGLSPALAVERLARLAPTPGRMEIVPLPGGAIALCDDYKSSIDTVHAAFETLATLAAPRKFIVLGGLDSPPSPQRTAYRAVAEHASRVADHVIIVGPGNVYRPYAPALGRALQTGLPLRSFEHAPRVEDAVRALQTQLRPGDVVLIKGQKQQHLQRIVLGLQGGDVKCAVDACRLHIQACHDCRLLNRRSPLGGVRQDERVIASPVTPIADDAPGEP